MRYSACVAFVLATCNASAIFYTGNGPGSSTIDPSGPADYSSLSFALSSIQNGPALTGGDWTLKIRGNLTESSNIIFAKSNTNGNRIIVRPDTNTSITVKFTSVSGRAHIAIGTTSTTEIPDGYVKTDNFIIDGSNNGTNSRNMTLLTDPTLNTPFTVVQIAGNSDGCQVKNCTIISTTTNQFNYNSFPFCAAIQFASYYYALSGLTNEYPDNGVAENNDITIGAFKNAVGIAATQRNFAGSAALPGGQAGIIVRNNRISACRGGIELQSTSGGSIYGNVISLDQQSDISDGYAVGIWSGKGGNSSTDVNIYNNQILKVHGKRGFMIPVSGIVVGHAATGFSYNIYNNMIADVQGLNIGEDVAGIYIGGLSPNAQNAYIYHNSVHMSYPGVERSISGIKIVCVSAPDSFTFGRTTNVAIKNNIFSNEETTGAIILKNTSGTLVSDYNSFYLRNGSAAELVQWQSQSSQDANSVYANPRTANSPFTGTWQSATDHHFTANPGPLFRGTPISGYTSDIDGEPRSATLPYKGPDEIQSLARVEEWHTY